jgi:acetate kinase
MHRSQKLDTHSRIAVPERYWKAGVRRYGFHGLSCESILHKLSDAVPPRLSLAHLGSGCSITAVANGRSVDTSMGLTPTGGIVMATRPGDLDPGIFPHMLRTTNVGPDELEHLLDRQSGMLGLSAFSGDMRQLRETTDNPRAQLAIEVFCRSAKKTIAGFISILGGLDLLVFTAGIGEHDAATRAEICKGLEPFNVAIDPTANRENRPVISASASGSVIRVIETDEDAQIARHTNRLFRS